MVLHRLRALLGDLPYRLYDRRIVRELSPAHQLPRHVGVITDGNRRWAKEFGQTTENGHRAGAGKIIEFLGWCDDLGIEVVTLYVLSKENLDRAPAEVGALIEIISDMVDRIAARPRVTIKLVGNLEVVPEDLRGRLVAAEERSTASASDPAEEAVMTVNIAVGYGGREEIVTAVKTLLAAEKDAGGDVDALIGAVTEEGISENLYTKGQPDPDLIIRSSGEQRLSGFMIWQSAYSEFYFCEAYWPDFRHTDFLRAVRSYSVRQRRFGK